MFTERQTEVVASWRRNGATIEFVREEGHVKVVATRNNSSVLLFIVEDIMD